MIGYSRLLNTLDITNGPFIKLNNIQLQYSSDVKNLGLTMTRTLDWTSHVTQTCNRTLKRISDFIPFSTKVMLVKTLIFPIFNYCDIVTLDMTVQLLQRMQRAHNYCVRFIFNLRRDDHVTEYLNKPEAA